MVYQNVSFFNSNCVPDIYGGKYIYQDDTLALVPDGGPEEKFAIPTLTETELALEQTDTESGILIKEAALSSSG